MSQYVYFFGGGSLSEVEHDDHQGHHKEHDSGGTAVAHLELAEGFAIHKNSQGIRVVEGPALGHDPDDFKTFQGVNRGQR